jgi:hypothetical protein
MNIAGYVYLDRTDISARDQGSLTVRPGSPASVSVHQSPGRANLYTSATKPAPRFLQGITKGSADKGLAAPVDKRNSPYLKHLLAHSNAPSAEDAQVVIPVKERTVPQDRIISGGVGEGNLLDPDIPGHFLQFAVLILGADNTPICHCCTTQAQVKGSAVLPSVAGDAGAGMLGKQ